MDTLYSPFNGMYEIIDQLNNLVGPGFLDHTKLYLSSNLLAFYSRNIVSNDSVYYANDGLVPLQSALFLDISDGIPFSTLSIFPSSNISLKNENIGEYKQVKKQYIFKGWDHLDLLDTSDQDYWATLISEIRAFTELPQTPSPVSPNDEETIYTLTPTFEWSTFLDSGDGETQVGYQLRVVCDDEGDIIVYDTGFVPDTLGNTHIYAPGLYSGTDTITGDEKISDSLVRGKHYHWHVRYRDSGGDWSYWSADILNTHINTHQDFFTSICSPGNTRSCETDSPGICAAGTETCGNGGTWGGCIPNNLPTNEVCDDDADNDCDGLVDSDDKDCVGDCTPNGTQPCNTGLLGICSVGTKVCNANGSWGNCIQDNESTDEVCDGQDNNCNGLVDENLCDDNNTCTADSCDPINGCEHTPVIVNDEDACTVDSCDPITGKINHNPISCNDSNACTVDSCNPFIGCVNTPISCDDSLYCNGSETCDGASGCQAGTAPNCGDGVGCTDDSCNETTDSCNNIANDAFCDDGVGCTNDSCDPVNDCQNVAADAYCNDGFGCTNDSCDPINDCQNIANDAYCDDGQNQQCDVCDPEDDAAETDGCVVDIPDCINLDVSIGAPVELPNPAIPGFDFSIWFEEVTTVGTVIVQDNWDNPGAFAGKFSLCGNYFDITLIGVAYNGAIEICAPYDPSLVQQGDNVYLMHFVNGQWEALDSTVGTNPDRVCGLTISLSPLAPAATPCADADVDGFFDQAGCGTDVDCNDGDGAINPVATEVCGDGVDNDCSGGDASCPNGGGGTQATGGGGGGGGGCSVISSDHNMSIGSAVANTLIFFLPFIVFGIRRKHCGTRKK